MFPDIIVLFKKKKFYIKYRVNLVLEVFLMLFWKKCSKKYKVSRLKKHGCWTWMKTMDRHLSKFHRCLVPVLIWWYLGTRPTPLWHIVHVEGALYETSYLFQTRWLYILLTDRKFVGVAVNTNATKYFIYHNWNLYFFFIILLHSRSILLL